MADGKIQIQSTDSRIYTVTPEVGAVGNVALTLPKEGGMLTVDAEVVHKTGDETKGGVLTLSDGLKLQGQNVSPFSGFKNYIINGNFDVWHRGTSQTASGYGSDDRWFNQNIGSTKTHSQVACTDTERELFNANYFSRTVVTSVVGTGNFVRKYQAIEDITKLAGKQVTVSFWIKADSNKNIAFRVGNVYGTGGSAFMPTNQQLVAVSTSWTKKMITFTVPSIVGKTITTGNALSIYFYFEAEGLIDGVVALGQQSGTFDIAQVQLEEGSVATPFEQRPYGLELSLCQRYYYKIGGTTAWQSFGNGTCSSSFADINFYLPTVMRTSPTLYYNGVLSNYKLSDGTSDYTPTSIVLQDPPSVGTNQLLLRVAATLTASRSCRLFANNSTSAYLTFSAEL